MLQPSSGRGKRTSPADAPHLGDVAAGYTIRIFYAITARDAQRLVRTSNAGRIQGDYLVNTETRVTGPQERHFFVCWVA